jgi:hypothetical protein
MQITASIMVNSASTVLYDRSSNLFISVGYSSVQTLLVIAFDPNSLKALWRYRLPLEVAWLLRSPRVSDGFLLFVGAQEPFLGTVFTVDLKQRQVYEQDPPTMGGNRRRPRRRRLPRAMVLESAENSKSSGPSLSSAHCAAVALADRSGSLVYKSEQSPPSDSAGSGEKAGPPEGHR